MEEPRNRAYDVGGVLLDRPFQIQRLGHFGFNCVNVDEAYTFYTQLLGFRVTDVRDDAKRVPPEKREAVGDTRGYFMRYGSDHHAFVLYNKRVRDLQGGKRQMPPQVTTNQITWQVASLAEVVNAHDWFVAGGQVIRRAGRDMPGSNWHTYLFDPDGHVHELYYGIEQIGWNGHSKPHEMHVRAFDEVAPLPQVSEQQEVDDAIDRGIDLLSGLRSVDDAPMTFDVDGIMLARPFKIVHMGPVRLFMSDIDAAARFYQHILGFTLTETIEWEGHRCLLLRAGTEHHSLGLYPIDLRNELGLSEHSTCMSLGLRLANHRQLRDARSFLEERGVKSVDLPMELFPGIDYAVHVRDPDGHVIQLFSHMEQVGWDGRPRPPGERSWHGGELPETIEPRPDTFGSAPFLGPWA